MKAYVIKHGYQVDGGYGDAVPTEETLFITLDEEAAKEYCRKWDDPYVYDTPYADLQKNHVFYEEIDIMDNLLPSMEPPKDSFYDPLKRTDADIRFEEDRELEKLLKD